MNTYLINKFVAAALATVLALIVINMIGNVLVPEGEMAEPAVAAKPEAPAEEAKAPATTETKPAGTAETSALALLAEADPAAGKKVARKCTACHSLAKDGPNKVGPNLWDIVGAGLGKKPGYSYSSALADVGGEWSYAALDAFITNPRAAIKGTKMSFGGIKKAKQRADLIAFLRSLSDQPKPLP